MKLNENTTKDQYAYAYLKREGTVESVNSKKQMVENYIRKIVKSELNRAK
jgi:DNA-binding transcriptional regulator YhcF (GntR family)